MTDKLSSKIEACKAWEQPGRCHFIDPDGNEWVVGNLWESAKNLPVQEMPMSGLCLRDVYPAINSAFDFVGHMKNVLDADMSFPIILNDEGIVMDGRHRIAKALLEEHETIKFVRFDKTPSPDLEVNND